MYCDNEEIRRAYGVALAETANNRRVKLSERDRAELRRISKVWLDTVPADRRPSQPGK
jgi:hypothetical protein